MVVFYDVKQAPVHTRAWVTKDKEKEQSPMDMDNELEIEFDADMPALTDLRALLVDWFETIEEVELTETDRYILLQLADLFAAFREDAMAQGVAPEDFEEWLRMDVLEHWSVLMEEMEGYTDTLQRFDQFVTQGEQRLYLQMLKRCLPLSQIAESA